MLGAYAHVFSFGEKQNYTTEHIGSFPVSEVYKELGSNKADVNNVTAAIRTVAEKTLNRRIRFNPYHDPANGRFTTADHAVDSPDQLLSYMRTLADTKYHPNIANLRVGGRAILHPEKSLGLKREQMPQIPTSARNDFLNSMRSELVELDPRKVYPTQAEIDGHKTAKFMVQSMADTDKFRPPIVSRDHYVIDGHHNWASRVVQAEANPSANVMMPAYLVDMNRDQLLARAHAYAQAHGFEAKPIHKFNPYHVPAGSPDGGEFTFALRETNGVAPEVGKPFLVYRAGSKDGRTLEYRNAGNSHAVASHLVSLDDPMHARYETQPPDTKNTYIHAFKVTLTDFPTNYRTYNGTSAGNGGLYGTNLDQVGFKSTTFGDAFAFGGNGKGYVAEHLASIPASEVLTELHDNAHRYTDYTEQAKGYANFYDWGSRAAGDAIQRVIGNHIYSQKFNPFHLPAGSPQGGEFTSANQVGQPVTPFDYADPDMREFAEHFGPFVSTQYGESGRLHYIENQAAHDLNKKLWDEQQKFLLANPALHHDIMDYQSTEYGPLNEYLRNGTPYDPRTNTVLPLSKAKSMAARFERSIDEAPVIPDGTTLYRAFRSDRVIARADAGDLEGKVFQDKAFLSTTTNPFIMGNFYDYKIDKSNAVLMRIKTEDNVRGIYTPAAWPSASIHPPGEYEVLLNRSTPLYIDKVTRLKSGGVILDATVYGKETRGKFNPYHHGSGDDRGGEFTTRDDSTLYFEVAPDPNDKELTRRWETLSPVEKEAVSNAIAKDIVPDVLKELGTGGKLEEVVGGYAGYVNPAFALEMDDEHIVDAAKLLGHGLSQDSMAVVSGHPIPGLDKVGVVTVALPPVDMTMDALKAHYANLGQLVDDKGQMLISGFTADNGRMKILNFSNKSDAEVAALVDKQLGKKYPVWTDQAYSALIEKKDYLSAGDSKTSGRTASVWQQSADRIRQAASRAVNGELRRRGKSAYRYVKAVIRRKRKE